jgi:hypothetical protein
MRVWGASVLDYTNEYQPFNFEASSESHGFEKTSGSQEQPGIILI